MLPAASRSAAAGVAVAGGASRTIIATAAATTTPGVVRYQLRGIVARAPTTGSSCGEGSHRTLWRRPKTLDRGASRLGSATPSLPPSRGFASASPPAAAAASSTPSDDNEGDDGPPAPPPPTPSRALYAAVDHREAHAESMAGRHGRQLALARAETVGMDYLDEEVVFGLLEDEEDDFLDDLDDPERGDDDDDGGGAGDSSGGEGEEEEDDDEDFDEEVGEGGPRMPSRYRADGSIKIDEDELVARRAGAPPSGGEGGVAESSFAVIRLAGTQHKVAVDDLVVCNKLRPVERWAVGAVLTLTGDDVLLVGSPQATYVGLPGVHGGAAVKVMVEEITRDATIVVFKKRRRKHSRRKNGFRREVTMLRILEIVFPSSHQPPPPPQQPMQS